MKHIRMIPILLISAGIFLLIMAVLFRDAVRGILSAVISVLLLGYLLYLILHREMYAGDEEESVLYLEWGKKIRLCLLYIQKEPSEEAVSAYQEGRFVKIRIQQTDHFLCPLDLLSFPNGSSVLILKKIKGSFFDEKKYLKTGAMLLLCLLLLGCSSFFLRLHTASNLTAFLTEHTQQISVTSVSNQFCYQNESFADFQFLLTICEASDHTAEFIKLFCINGDSYQLRTISLNQNLFINGRHFGEDINACLQEKNYAGISQIVSEYFKIRTDHLIIMNYDALCEMAQDDCISLTADKSLYYMKYVSAHRERFHVDGNYNYSEAVSLLDDLRIYTEQCAFQGRTGTFYLEQMLSELQNDLIYSLLIKIAKQQQNAPYDCLLTDLSETDVRQLNAILHYRKKAFRNQLENPNSQTCIPYLSDCEMILTNDRKMLAYVPDGFIDSRIIKEFYYTLSRK